MKAVKLIAAAAAVILLAGCSSDGGSGSRSPGVWDNTGSGGPSVSSSSAAKTTVSSKPEESVPEPESIVVEITGATGYYYDLITEKRLKTAMLLMLKGMREHSESIDLRGLDVANNEIKDLLEILLDCEPDLWWVDNNYEVSTDSSDRIHEVYFKYKLDPAAEKKASAELHETVDLIVSATEGMDDFERLLYFHDTVVKSCVYDRSADNPWSAYGCLVEGRAVCEGYSKALIALCEQAGILCLPVNGTSGKSGHELHMWNKVRMDGEWYNMDLTWDDPAGDSNAPQYEESQKYDFIHREYFGQTDAHILRDHSFNETAFMKYPAADAVKDNYFIRTGRYISDADSAHDVIYSAAAQTLDNGENIFQLGFADETVYDLFLANELEGGGIFDVFSELANEGYLLNTSGYEYLNNEDQLVLTLIMKTE